MSKTTLELLESLGVIISTQTRSTGNLSTPTESFFSFILDKLNAARFSEIPSELMSQLLAWVDRRRHSTVVGQDLSAHVDGPVYFQNKQVFKAAVAEADGFKPFFSPLKVKGLKEQAKEGTKDGTKEGTKVGTKVRRFLFLVLIQRNAH